MVDVPKIKIQEISTDPAPTLAGIAIPHTRGGQTWKVGGETLAELVHADEANLPVTDEGVAFLRGVTGSGAPVRAHPFWINASDYLGVLAPSAAVQAAITACSNVGGGTVYVPAGTWAVSSTITIPSKVKLVGAGIDSTIFAAANNLNSAVFTTTGTDTLWSGTTEAGAQYWGIAECTIRGNKANQSSGCGIKTYSRAYRIENVKIEYCKEKGFQSRWGDGPAYDDDDDEQYDLFMESKIDNLLVQYCDQEGFWFDGPHDSRISNVICGVNSHAVAGSYSGFYFGSRAGGTQVSDCHGWGEEQKHAFEIETGGICFSNCYADEGYTSLVHMNAANIKWIGGNVIGGYINTPPSTSDKTRKGFTFGPNAWYPMIIANVVNCPKGAIDFTNVGNLGGYIVIFGHLDAAIQTGATGESTYGFQGSVPSSFSVNVRIVGVGNNYSAQQLPESVSFADGNASFPSIRRASDITTGMFFASNKVGIAVGGAEIFKVGPDYVSLPPRSSTPVSTWFAGMAYFDTTLNKGRVYDGTAWQNLW